MRTKFRTRQELAEIFLCIAKDFPVGKNEHRPERFMRIMESHKGSCMDREEDTGLLKRNPLIVALGDSVTAGHFEWTPEGLKFMQDAADYQLKVQQEGAEEDNVPESDWKTQSNLPVMEVTDARESYVEKFRYALIDKYQETSVSIINAGIAGDTLRGMKARLQRDVISHQPDLVLLNGSLNWGEDEGSTEEYKKLLKLVIREIKKGTKADIILLTPNADLPNPFLGTKSTLKERVQAIREEAAEEEVCLCDVYAVWEKYREEGYDWCELLANGINHPSVTGHEVYAILLMKLLQ